MQTSVKKIPVYLEQPLTENKSIIVVVKYSNVLRLLQQSKQFQQLADSSHKLSPSLREDKDNHSIHTYHNL